MTALDPVIHADSRLRIMAALAGLPAGDEVLFARLRKDLSMTAGNLSTHLRKLEEAGYLTQTKTIEGRTPATYLTLTATGRAAYETYLTNLRTILEGNP